MIAASGVMVSRALMAIGRRLVTVSIKMTGRFYGNRHDLSLVRRMRDTARPQHEDEH